LALHALDGTKIAAQVSTEKAMHREELEKYLSRLEEEIEEVMKQTGQTQESERGGYALPPEMADAARRRAQIAQSLQEMDAARCDHLHACDKEARVMKVEGRQKLGYNAQAVTEAKDLIIVAADVTNEANDSHQLTGMIQQAQETTGRKAEETVADSGYCCAEELDKAHEQAKPVLVNIKPATERGDKQYAKSQFAYDPDGDGYVCPHGERLEYAQTRERDGRQIKSYRCRHDGCAHRARCTADARGRTIERDCLEEAIERQKKRQQEPGKQALLRRRKEIAELSFARIKALMGFRRWTVRGLANVKAQWALICAVSNMKVLCNAWKLGKLRIA